MIKETVVGAKIVDITEKEVICDFTGNKACAALVIIGGYGSDIDCIEYKLDMDRLTTNKILKLLNEQLKDHNITDYCKEIPLA